MYSLFDQFCKALYILVSGAVVRPYFLAASFSKTPFCSNRALSSNLSWVEHAKRIRTRLIDIMTPTPCRFLHDRCTDFLHSRRLNALRKTRAKVYSLVRSAWRCKHLVINKIGLGPELDEVSDIQESVNLISSWLDEIIQAAEERRLVREFKHCCLKFQSVRTEVILQPYRSNRRYTDITM
jgi:hypothetical protein